MRNCVSILTCLLIVMAMMWPSEAAIHGDGLHLAILWIVTAIVATWTQPEVRFRNYHLANASRIGGAAIFLLVLGFWLSTWHVFGVSGDRRAALNLTLEWTAIGVVYWLVSKMAARKSFHQGIVILLISLGFGVATLGLAQHHFMYQRQAEWYQQLRLELDGAISSPGIEAAARRKSIESDFNAMGIPLDGASRELFERRMIGSSEPVGPFALANSLGGVLALTMVILLGTTLHRLRHTATDSVVFLCRIAPLFLMMAYCLLLTKSRTAWIASGIGTTLLILSDIPSFTKVKRVLIVGGLVIAVIVAAGIGTGAIDKEVVLESPRSLQFRLYYWMGAAGVIKEEPVFGAGPGNFRQVYLGHKSVESSEEILDPHNVLFDAWCSSGLTGFFAICLLIATVAKKTMAPSTRHEACRPQESIEGRRIAVWGVSLGFITHLLWNWFNGETFWDASAPSFWESQNMILLVPVGAIIAILLVPLEAVFTGQTAAAAATTLIIHLFGAGGLQITSIGLILIITFALSNESTPRCTESNAKLPSPWPRRLAYQMVVTALLVTCVGAIYGLGFQPVRAAATYSVVAEIQKQRRNTKEALDHLVAAITADPLSVDLRQQYCELLTYVFLRDSAQLARKPDRTTQALQIQFDRAMIACNNLISADKRSIGGYQRRSMLAAAAYQSDLGNDKLFSAIEDLQQVLKMYPTNSVFWADLAALCNRAGQNAEARSAAETAIKIDTSNHNWGHVDRYLSSETLAELASIRTSKQSD